MRHSLVTICPASIRDDLINLGRAYGVEGGMTVELSEDGNRPATHYGSHSWATPEFIAIVKQEVTVPIEGYTSEEVSELLSACTFTSSQSPNPINSEHFNNTISSLGLQKIIILTEDL